MTVNSKGNKPKTLLDICPHCKNFVDIVLDPDGYYLQDAVERKMKAK